MRTLTLRSPAKLNLYLKVLNKRPDGFHNIVTLFERIDIFDEIKFSLNSSGKIKIVCNHPHVPTGSKNLIYKIAAQLQRDFHITQGVNIVLKKNIPVAAGLAGGSSNAAVALVALNKLWELKLSRPQLLSYAAKIGSDVSFFLYNCSWALGTGRGEKITPLPIKAKLCHVVVTPKVKLLARDVYGALKQVNSRLDLPQKSPPTNMLTKKVSNVNILIHHLKKSDLDGVGLLFCNDLESPVEMLYPAILKLKKKLKSLNTQGVMISGSGPSVFALVSSQKQAQQIRQVLKKRFAQVFSAKTF